MLFSIPSFAHVLEEMTVDQKIGQLFIAAAYPSQDAATTEGVEEDPFEVIHRLVKEYHIGGVIFKHRWSVDEETKLIQSLQSKSIIPLFILQDGEWGLSMRLRDTVRFPKNTTLGAIQDNSLIHAMGKEIARQFRQIGVNFNLSPVVDINNNLNNPVIGMRSFGDDPEVVSEKGIAMMSGLQDGGILSCAKHFPGHGDTDQDSHKTLPLISSDSHRLTHLELVPFKRLIQAGIKSVMTAHLEVPALEESSGKPASLSQAIVTDLLRLQLNFKGLIITDDLMMKGITDNIAPAEAALSAFLAGNDLLLASTAVPVAIARIKDAYLKGIITEKMLDEHVERILTAKQWLQDQVSIDDFPENSLALKRKLYRSSISVLSDNFSMDVLHFDRSKDVFIIFGENCFPAFFSTLMPETKIVTKELFLKDDFSSVFIVISNSADYPEAIAFARTAKSLKKEVRIISFCSPYALLPYLHEFPILMAYEDDDDAQEAAADVLLNKLSPVYRKFHSTEK